MNRPRTAAELMALPEGGGFGLREDVIDGKLIQRPIAPDLVLFYSDPTDVISCVDADGQGWKLGLYADGRWCRRRIG